MDKTKTNGYYFGSLTQDMARAAQLGVSRELLRAIREPVTGYDNTRATQKAERACKFRRA